MESGKKDNLRDTKLYKFCLWKAYFDLGFGLLSYPKYVLFLVGAADIIRSDGDYSRVLILGIVIAVGCLLVGKWLYSNGYRAAEHEVQNYVNPLAIEIRKKLKPKSI